MALFSFSRGAPVTPPAPPVPQAPVAPAAPAPQPPAAPARPFGQPAAPAAPPRSAFAGAPQVPQQAPRGPVLPPSNLFAGVPSAEPSTRHPFLQPGRMVVVITDVTTFPNRKNLWRVMVEVSILDVVAEMPGTNRPNTKAIHTYSFEHDSFSRNVKGMLLGVMRLPSDAVVEQSDVELACGAARTPTGDQIPSPLIGLVADITVSHVPTKNGQGVWTQVDWNPGPSFAEIAAAIPDAAKRNLHWTPGLFEKLLADEQAQPR